MLFHSLGPTGIFLLSLYGTGILALTFLGLLPWLVLRTFPRIEWLAPARPLMWIVIGFCWAFGLLLTLDLINVALSNGYRSDIWVKAIAATVIFILVIAGHFKWPWLNRLYSETSYMAQVRCNQMLLQKMEVWDQTMPIARFESRNGQILDANCAAEQLTGYTVAELTQGAPGFMIHPEDFTEWVEHIHKKSTATYEARILHKTGRIIRLEVYSVLAPYDTDLRITFATDVTEYRQQLEQQIRCRQRSNLQEDRKTVVASTLKAALDYGSE